MKDDWVYRPINAEIEITSKCNQSCRHCGMASNGMSGESYTINELDAIVNDLSQNGVISLSITGGEPFVEFENMLELLRICKNKIDICKITTNGFWGENVERYFMDMGIYW